MRNEIKEMLKEYGNVSIADWKISQEFRRGGELVDSRVNHLRGQKIPKWASKEGAGVKVLAMSIDELENVIALMPNGGYKQFI